MCSVWACISTLYFIIAISQRLDRWIKQYMLVTVKLGADFSRGCAHPAMQPPISATHPPPRNAKKPEPHWQGSGPKWIMRRATVDGALAWGRRIPAPERYPSTARKAP